MVEFIDLVKQLLCQKIFKPLYDVQLKKMAPLKDQQALVAVTISAANEMQRSGPPKDGQKYHQFLAYLVFCFKQLGQYLQFEELQMNIIDLCEFYLQQNCGGKKHVLQ